LGKHKGSFYFLTSGDGVDTVQPLLEEINMNFRKTVLAVSLSACTGAAVAADKVPTLGEVLKASDIVVSGYIDTSYTYLEGTGTFSTGGTPTPNRVYDRERRSFNLHTLDLSVGYQPASGFGGFAQVDLGSDAMVSASAGTNATDDVDVQEAYMQYASGKLTVIGGKFATTAGAEVIESPSNLNFSRSILFGYAIPFTHTGLRATYAMSDALKIFGGVNNGWDVVKESASGDGGTNKTLELGVSSNPTKELSLAAGVHTGEEPGSVAGVNGVRTLVDVVATYAVSDALSFTLNYDTAKQDDAIAAGTDAKWNGLAGYVNYKMNDKWRVAFRTESFDDKNGFRTGVTQKWKESTLTLANTPAKNVELRGEVRHDSSNQSSFNYPDGTTKKSQDSVALEAIYKF
jgi:hypothetical protein